MASGIIEMLTKAAAVKMTFSEAMREGTRRSYKIESLRHDGLGGTCALGAAELGAGLVSEGDRWPSEIGAQRAEMAWPWIDTEKALHPEEWRTMQINCIVASLNNGAWTRGWGTGSGPEWRAWTRERIADWVEEVELRLTREGVLAAAEAPAQPEPPEAVTEAVTEAEEPVCV